MGPVELANSDGVRGVEVTRLGIAKSIRHGGLQSGA